MPLQEINEILSKYQKQEETIKEQLENIELNIKQPENNTSNSCLKFITYEEAKQRNQEILKELEIVKGNLRSKAIFSPAEMQWEKICKEYREQPALPVTTWKCNLPVFV